MESFHLAYVPAVCNVAVDDVSSSKSRSDEKGKGRAIAIRRASSLRLYRCHRRHAHDGESNGRDDNYFTVDSSGNSASDTTVDERSDENCQWCYRAERCSQDSLFTEIDSEVSDNTLGDMNGNKKNREADMLLAVLVPSSLSQSLSNMVDPRSNEPEITTHQIIDSELELRRSIHPCLCSNERQRTTHLDGVKSNEEHDRVDSRQSEIIDGNTSSSTIYPQLFVCGIITSNDVSICTNFPADVVLLAPKDTLPTRMINGRKKHFDRCHHLISHYMNLINHDTASGAPWSVLKAFPVSSLSILPMNLGATSEGTSVNPDAKAFDVAALPCCPVCLNLIEPTNLGLPQLKPRHMCFRWCLGSKDHHDNNVNSNKHSRHHACTNEMNFSPLPQCAACQVISKRGVTTEYNSSFPHRSQSTESHLMLSPTAPWRAEANFQDQYDEGRIAAPYDHSLTRQTSQSNSCYQCGMSTTLWVCLTCGVVGCGRYTRKHAAQHYTMEGHPYSFELATGRIWDYDNGTFVHRRDLVECPVLSMNWGIAVAGVECPSSPLIASSAFGGSQLR